MRSPRIERLGALPSENLNFTFGGAPRSPPPRPPPGARSTTAPAGPAAPSGLSALPAPATPAVTLQDARRRLRAGIDHAGLLPVRLPEPDSLELFRRRAGGAGKASFDELVVGAGFAPIPRCCSRAWSAAPRRDGGADAEQRGGPAGRRLGPQQYHRHVRCDRREFGALPSENLTFAFGAVTEATASQAASWSQVTNSDSSADIPTAPSGLSALSPAAAPPAVTLQLTPAGGSAVSIALDSYQFGFQNVANIGVGTSGISTGKPSFDELVVGAEFAPDSPLLFQSLVSGAGYATAGADAEQRGGPAGRRLGPQQRRRHVRCDRRQSAPCRARI